MTRWQSFWLGFGRVLDLGGTLRRRPRLRRRFRTDEEAMASDWQMVGDDLRRAHRKTARKLSA